MSIKPIFAKEIYEGIKKYELRRKIFGIEPFSLVILYESSPKKAITGKFIAGKVVEMNSEVVIRLINEGKIEGCTELDIPYVTGKRKILVIEVLNPKKYKRELTLSIIRSHIPKFKPPLSYMRLKNKSLLSLIKKWEKRYG